MSISWLPSSLEIASVLIPEKKLLKRRRREGGKEGGITRDQGDWDGLAGCGILLAWSGIAATWAQVLLLLIYIASFPGTKTPDQVAEPHLSEAGSWLDVIDASGF